MAYTISTSLLSGTLTEKLEQAAIAGFSKIDIHVQEVISSELSPKQIRSLADSLHLGIGKVQPFYDLEGLSGSEKKRAFTLFKAFLNTAATLGAPMVLLGSSSHPNASVNRDEIINDLAAATSLAKEHSLRIAYLPLPWATHIKDAIEAYSLVEGIDDASFGLGLNSYFALADGSKPARYRDLNGDRIFSVQLADAPRHDVDISRFKHEFATLPGLGNLNLVDFTRIVVRGGYRGDWSLARMGRSEIINEDSAIDGWRSLANVIDLARQNTSGVDFGVDELPERGRANGFEFLEFVVDEESGQELRQLLSSLCFRLERTHKSKKVELWRQGAINIIVNFATEGFAHEALVNAGPGLCDMALRVDDAHLTVSRARALDIMEVSQPVGSDELEIPAIEGVGSSILRFVDEQSNLHRLWEIDFNALDSQPVVEPAGLRRIDHLAQTMERVKLNSWLLFYLSVFEMKKAPLVDLVDPGGIVYSRAVESPEGEVRITLNGANSPQKTFSSAFLSEHSTAGVQHIAFATDDIFETSKRLESSAFERIVFPKNYYDDLAIRYELSEELLKRLSANNILYSRNDQGEFYQIYSRPIWGGFFIEIVQRRSGYKGYGAQNAAVRLAAQTRYLNAKMELKAWK